MFSVLNSNLRYDEMENKKSKVQIMYLALFLL